MTGFIFSCFISVTEKMVFLLNQSKKIFFKIFIYPFVNSLILHTLFEKDYFLEYALKIFMIMKNIFRKKFF
jgi:hypothetical protein